MSIVNLLTSRKMINLITNPQGHVWCQEWWLYLVPVLLMLALVLFQLYVIHKAVQMDVADVLRDQIWSIITISAAITFVVTAIFFIACSKFSSSKPTEKIAVVEEQAVPVMSDVRHRRPVDNIEQDDRASSIMSETASESTVASDTPTLSTSQSDITPPDYPTRYPTKRKVRFDDMYE